MVKSRIDLSRTWSTDLPISFDARQWDEHYGADTFSLPSRSKKKILKICFRKNGHFFRLTTYGPLIIGLSSNLVTIVTGDCRGLPVALFWILELEYYRDIANFLRRIFIIGNISSYWPLVTSIWNWPKNYLGTYSRTCPGLSIAFYLLSLRCIVPWFPRSWGGGGGVLWPPLVLIRNSSQCKG